MLVKQGETDAIAKGNLKRLPRHICITYIIAIYVHWQIACGCVEDIGEYYSSTVYWSVRMKGKFLYNAVASPQD